ncbi:MAG: beta-ketoacyl-ACP synthase II [Chthoniobacterales bacterium]
MKERRVVITGMGVATPLGNELETFWDNLLAGRSGVDTISNFDTTGYPCKIGGEIRNFDPKPVFNNPKEHKRTDRFTHFAMAAAKGAMADANFDLEKVDRDRFGVMVSSGIGGLKTLEDQHSALVNKGPDRVSAFTIPMLIGNMASGLISMEWGLRGPNMCIVTACATSNTAIGEAWRIIKFGDADVLLAGGSEAAIIPVGLAGFSAMKALSTRNDEPKRASRPFDKDRDGFVIGEGGGVVVVEELEHAQARGAKIYCELAGYGLSGDAYHMTAPPPDGEGAARAMRMSLKHAGLAPEQVDYLNAHATSTGLGDICETRAIKSVFDGHAQSGALSISSTKSMTGHLLGGAGAIELAVCVLAMRDSKIPPTINLDNPDAECDLDYTAHVMREKEVNVAVNNSFGFGGHNATIVVKKFAA